MTATCHAPGLFALATRSARSFASEPEQTAYITCVGTQGVWTAVLTDVIGRCHEMPLSLIFLRVCLLATVGHLDVDVQ